MLELVDSSQERFWIGPPAERPQRPVLGFPGNYVLLANLNVNFPEGIYLLHMQPIMDILSP